MKKVILCLLAALCLILVSGCNKAKGYEIAFVTDIGQLKDKSFNQGTWEGVEKFAKENNKTYKYYQPANGDSATDEDRAAAMNAAITNGAKIVVCAGFMQATALEKVAKANPKVKFVFIDGWAMGLENITAVVFKEEQSGYLAGYAAVMEGYTKLGFSGGGGGTNPACQRFGYGYIQGANDAAKAKDITVTMNYTWKYGESFSGSPELKTLLDGWYSVNGIEVVFTCGGSICNNAFAAASENNGKVIGVDVDQSSASNTVITSATKGLSAGTIYALEQFYNGKWADISDKTANLGVESNAVGLPTETWSMQNFTVEKYTELFNKIKDGSIVIDNVVEGAETKTYSNVTLNYIQ